jgi:hypothetical protein
MNRFPDFDAYRHFMINQGLSITDDGRTVYKFELPQTIVQKLIGRATEIELTVHPLTAEAFENAFHEWQGTHDFHDETWGSAEWKRKVSVRQAFRAACVLNPDLYAALLPKMTRYEAMASAEAIERV